MLPSTYEKMEYVYDNYIDSGVTVQSGLKIECMFGNAFPENASTGTLFGGRNQASTSSTNQLGVQMASGGYYFCYNDGRSTIAFPSVSSYEDLTTKIEIDNNSCTINNACMYTREGSRTAATFTGARTIYIGALNNAGTALRSISPDIYYFKIWKDGELIRDFVPCRRISDDVAGMYDLANDVFYIPSSGVFEKPRNNFTVVQANNGLVQGDIGYYDEGMLTAIPNNGYEFAGWYSNGNVFSYDNPLYFDDTSPRTITPSFQKIFEDDFKIGYKLRARSRYRYSDAELFILDRTYYEMEVLSADISEDGLQKASSTITVKDVPSAVTPEQIVTLYSPKGKEMYRGVIESIEGTTIKCRESLAYFDFPCLFHINTNRSGIVLGSSDVTSANIQYALLRYLFVFSQSDYNVDAISNTNNNIRTSITEKYIRRYENAFTDVDFPLIEEIESKNLEELLFEMFRDFNIVTELSFDMRTGMVTVRVPKYNDALTIADNMDCVHIQSVDKEYTNTNLIYVYSSDGSTFRAMYVQEGVNTNTERNTIPCVQEIVMSDDKLKTIKEQYTTDNYNHKIVFTMDFPNNFYSVDSLKVGNKINIYEGDQFYESVITGKQYSIEGSDIVHEIKYTLGKARTNLSSKINLKKVK